jgi:choline dehydrogenase-like flavoprotein
VIVGAGSAGCVLANRLTEDPDVTVAIVEAGGADTADEIHIPAAFPALFKTSMDWDLLGEQEPGLGGRRMYLPRGRMLGGSSSMNAMIYMRGNRLDYDGWAAEGHRGWGYDDVLPYFRRAEDNERGEDAYHGTGGPLAVSDSRSNHALVDACIQATIAAGHEHNPDFNGPRQEGVGAYQLTQRDGMRCSTADAYLRPAQARPNLTVVTDALTTRVVFEGERAVGIEIAQYGQLRTLRAQREVILSAGAYQSPVLLMLSGIGPAADLEPLMIDVRANLPVGENLQDHLMAQGNWTTDVPSLLDAVTPENVALLTEEQRGPLTSNIAEAGAFFRTRPGLEAPDVQFHYAAAIFWDEGLQPPPEHGWSFGPLVAKPTSRGRVFLRAALPDAKPRVLHNYLTTEEDRRSMIAGVRILMEIARQEPLTSLATGAWRVPASDSEEDIMDFVRLAGQTVYHPTSTCAMGAVVDDELRVLGVEGLRVVDASVMPSITRGNTNAPTIMIAEKAADLIRSHPRKPADAKPAAALA